MNNKEKQFAAVIKVLNKYEVYASTALVRDIVETLIPDDKILIDVDLCKICYNLSAYYGSEVSTHLNNVLEEKFNG